MTNFQQLTLCLIVINCIWIVDDHCFPILRRSSRHTHFPLYSPPLADFKENDTKWMIQFCISHVNSAHVSIISYWIKGFFSLCFNVFKKEGVAQSVHLCMCSIWKNFYLTTINDFKYLVLQALKKHIILWNYDYLSLTHSSSISKHRKHQKLQGGITTAGY